MYLQLRYLPLVLMWFEVSKCLSAVVKFVLLMTYYVFIKATNRYVSDFYCLLLLPLHFIIMIPFITTTPQDNGHCWKIIKFGALTNI